MGHWEDTCGAACEVWELETCSGALMLLLSGNCNALCCKRVPGNRQITLICPVTILGSACRGQGDPAWSPAVPVVLPALPKNTLGDGAAQLGPCLQLAALGGLGSVGAAMLLRLGGRREERGVLNFLNSEKRGQS